MVSPRSFAELVAATAPKKLAAANARQNPDVAAEKPREAIFEALEMVGDAIAADGFSLARSAPKFSRKSGDLTFEITVQSDRNNVAGQRAAIWVHVGVYSKCLTAWQKNHPSDWIRPRSPCSMPVYANQLGYLCDPAGWAEWDFADKANRGSVTDDLITSIRTGAYPLFATFDGAIDGVAALADNDWPPPKGILGYLLSLGRTPLATDTLRNYLDKRSEFRRDFDEFYGQFAETGLPLYQTAIPHDLAAFAVATGLTSNGS